MPTRKGKLLEKLTRMFTLNKKTHCTCCWKSRIGGKVYMRVGMSAASIGRRLTTGGSEYMDDEEAIVVENAATRTEVKSADRVKKSAKISWQWQPLGLIQAVLK